jgi:hypothetical protein
MTTPLLIRAAELLEREAAVIADSYRTSDGAWAPDDDGAKAEHDELIDVAGALRIRHSGQVVFAKHMLEVSRALNSVDGDYRP